MFYPSRSPLQWIETCKDATTLSYLYPENWAETYSTKRKKGPRGGKRKNSVSTDKKKNRIPLRELFISTSVIKDSFESADNIKGAVKGIMDAIRSDSYDIIDLQYF